LGFNQKTFQHQVLLLRQVKVSTIFTFVILSEAKNPEVIVLK